MRVQGIEDAPQNVERHVGLEALNLISVQHLGRHPELPRPDRERPLLRKSPLRAQENQQPLAPQPEGILRAPGQLLEERPAREVQVAEERAGPARARGARGAPEVKPPGEETGIEARVHVERALRISHPPQRLLDDARRREREEMARRDESRVPEGTAVMVGPAAIEDRDAMPALEKVVGGAKPDHARAAYHHVPRCHFGCSSGGARASFPDSSVSTGA